MEREIQNLPERQQEFVSNLVESRGQKLGPGAFLMDMPLARSPSGDKILTVTYTEGLGRIKTMDVIKADESLPIIDKQRMEQLVR